MIARNQINNKIVSPDLEDMSTNATPYIIAKLNPVSDLPGITEAPFIILSSHPKYHVGDRIDYDTINLITEEGSAVALMPWHFNMRNPAFTMINAVKLEFIDTKGDTTVNTTYLKSTPKHIIARMIPDPLSCNTQTPHIVYSTYLQLKRGDMLDYRHFQQAVNEGYAITLLPHGFDLDNILR